MKIGIVGEAPNDTAAIENLLTRRYSDKGLTFVNLLFDMTGDMLETKRAQTLLRQRNIDERPDLIIFVRDLDALWSDRTQRFKRKRYFVKSNNVTGKIGIPLLHVYEIEALILADIGTFNKLYDTTISNFPNPSDIIEPKELLKIESGYKYSESHNAKIFKQLNFNNLLDCLYFKIFIDNFEKLIT